MDSNYADKRSQISELQSLRDLVKRQTDQIAMLKEQLRDATSEERGDYHQRRELVKEVQLKKLLYLEVQMFLSPHGIYIDLNYFGKNR